MFRLSKIVPVATAAVITLIVASTAVAADDDPESDTGDAEPAADSRRVAVVALGEGTQSGALMKSASGLLDRARYDVVAGDRLAKILGEYQADPVSEKISKRFAGISNVIGEGVKSFFYKGNETTVEKLSPIFDLGMNHPEVLVRRPDFADQIFQAGIVLVRAYKNLEQEENARATARMLVRRLPGKEPSPSTAPPNIIRFFRAQQKKLAEAGTKLSLETVGGDDCKGYVNGSAIGEKTVTVAAGDTYYVMLECGRAEAPVWKVSLEEGQEAKVPVVGTDPLQFVMENGNFRQRKRAEAVLRLVAHWTGIEQVLGIKNPKAANTGGSVLVVRVTKNGEATWSDSAKEEEINRAIARVMPDYEHEPGSSGSGTASQTDRAAPWLDWALIGGGGAFVVGGTVFAVLTEKRGRQIRCSTGATSNCDAVTLLEFESEAELEKAEREVSAARIGYISAFAVGAGLSTWGVYRLLTRKAPPSAAAKPRIRFAATPRPDGFSTTLRLRW